MENTIERHAPGFKDLIAARFVQSPADIEHANPSLAHGTINGDTA